MKRVQALVTGKKKQCTKLPKPPSPGEGKAVLGPEAALATPHSSQDSEGFGGGETDTGLSHETVPSAGRAVTGSSAGVGASVKRDSSKKSVASQKKEAKDENKVKVSNKERRASSRSVAKSESFSSKSSKEKKKDKNATVSTDKFHKDDGSISPAEPGLTLVPDSGQVIQNNPTDEQRETGKDDSSSPFPSPTSAAPPETTKENSISHVISPAQTQRTNTSDSDKPLYPEQSMRTGSSNLPPSQQQQQQQQQHPQQHPLHGILKDSSNTAITRNTPAVNDIGGQTMDNYPPAKPVLRSGSLRVNTGSSSQQIYGSLPRNSRLAVYPVQDGNYQFGSFPRRANNTSTPVQHQEWDTLARRAESESRFASSTLDRNHPGAGRSAFGAPGYPQVNYSSVVNHGYQSSRSGSLRTYANDPRIMLNGAGPSSGNYHSDTESAGRFQRDGGYSRSVRAGSVPLGYESDSGTYRASGGGMTRQGWTYESDYGRGSNSSLRVQAEDEQYRAAPGRRAVPRRHTVGVSGNKEGKDAETERKREAFMQLLAQRYPKYADRIQGDGLTPSSHLSDQPVRSREGQRRRAALVAYNPNVSGNSSLEYEDLATMSDLEGGGFQRGGFSRTSMPIVRSSPSSMERPLGLAFLVYGDQTKKSWLPNEISSLDTVRALFVRAFPDLTLEMLENPRKKIYLLDPATNIYFQLEDLADIKDRSVLKIHETDNDQPQKVKDRQEVRGRTVQALVPAVRLHSHQPYGDSSLEHPEVFTKAHSLPPQPSHHYQDMIQDQRNQWEQERRSRSRTPEPADRSQRSLSAGSSTRQRFSHSPDRLPTPERMHPLNPIPENRQTPLGYPHHSNGYYEPVGSGPYRGKTPAALYDYLVPSTDYPVATTPRLPASAYPPARPGVPGHDMRDSVRGFNGAWGYPTTEGGYQRSHSYRVSSAERDGKDLSRSHTVMPADGTARNRIEKMEQQLADLTAWVHYQKDGTVSRNHAAPAPGILGRVTSDSSDTLPSSSASSLSDLNDRASSKRMSDLSSRESTPLSAQAELGSKLAQLKSDLHALRHLQQQNMEVMKSEFLATSSSIKETLASLPETDVQSNLKQRKEASVIKNNYISEKLRLDSQLGDLEARFLELKSDAVSKQCRVNPADIDSITSLVEALNRSLADLKVRFADIYSQMKQVLEAELKILSTEEKFLREEPVKIENSVRRCRQICESISAIKRNPAKPEPSLSSLRTTSGTKQSDQQVSQDKQEVASFSKELNREVTAKRGNLDSESHDRHHPEEAPLLVRQHPTLPYADDEHADDVELRAHAGLGSHSVRARSLPAPRPAPPPKSVTTTRASSAVTSQASVITTASFVPYTSPAPNVASVKPSFTLTSALGRVPEKPTATVSALTTGVSDTIPTSATREMEKEPNIPVMKNVVIPLTQTSIHGANSPGPESPKDGVKSPKRREAPVYTYQVCGPVNPVFPVPPVASNTSQNSAAVSSDQSPTDSKSTSPLTALVSEPSRHSSLKTADLSPKADSAKKVNVSFSDPPVTSVSGGQADTSAKSSLDKPDLTSHRQTARSAFFSFSNSSTSPSRNSVSLDPGPVLSPSASVPAAQDSPTINLVLTGSVSPMSPNNPGSFTITPALELSSLISAEDTTSPIQPASTSSQLTENNSKSLSLDAELDTSKQKKVPPPPPPRQSSRPTSASLSPINGTSANSVTPSQKELPRFVGGVLGQHRSSGGILTINSTVQSGLKTEQVSQSGSSDAGKQSLKQMNETNQLRTEETVTLPSPADKKYGINNNNNNDSGSSSGSETTDSQHSVVSVVRSFSVSTKDNSKTKPDTPKRHSSFLSKFTSSSKNSKSKLNNGKANNMNGINY